MKSLVIKSSVIFLALAAGFLVALPTNSVNKADASSCVGGKCPKLTNKYNPAWKGFKCPDARIAGNLEGDMDVIVQGTLDSRYRKSSPRPGCADIVQVNGVKKYACYEITFKGVIDIQCTSKTKMPRDAFYNLKNKRPESPILFNGQRLNNTTSTPISYQQNHKYTYRWWAGDIATSSETHGGKIVMKVDDSQSKSMHIYLDNSGAFQFKIKKVAITASDIDCANFGK